MPSNSLAPQGLLFSRNNYGGAPTYQANLFYIKSGYASSIGRGDYMKTGTGGNLGYVVLATSSDTAFLGVFAGVLPYYNTATQATAYGLNGSWVANTTSDGDVPCLVVSDPQAEFIAQVNGGTYDQSWRGKNINFVNASNGAPNAAGISTLVLDYSTLNTTNTLPFRILGSAGVVGGPMNPNNTNPWIIVKSNLSEMFNTTGI